jgi:isopentenyl phosphate kinase
MFIIKLGGSVITDKLHKSTFEKARTRRLVSEIKEAGKRTTIVCGAGSFGHILAKEHNLHEGYRNEEQLKALAEVQRDVRELNVMVMNAFLEEGINPVSLAPSSFLINDNGNIKSIDPSPFKRYFDLGFTPITFGDVVLDEALKFSICSGDSLMLELAKAFKPEKAIFVANVDGIFDSDPHVNKNAELLPVVDEEMLSTIKKSESSVDDVTGSIFGKLEVMFELAAFGTETIILNGMVESRLKDALRGKVVTCTKVLKRQKGGH